MLKTVQNGFFNVQVGRLHKRANSNGTKGVAVETMVIWDGRGGGSGENARSTSGLIDNRARFWG